MGTLLDLKQNTMNPTSVANYPVLPPLRVELFMMVLTSIWASRN
jgi:hypothetical protein